MKSTSAHQRTPAVARAGNQRIAPSPLANQRSTDRELEAGQAILVLKSGIGRVWRSCFVRSMAVVASATAGGQAPTMAIAPVITRLYGPEAYGLLATFLTMVSVLTPVAALTHPVAIVPRLAKR